MKVPRWHGQVTDDGGRITLGKQAPLYRKWLKTLAGQYVTVTVELPTKKPTAKQHGWYRGYALPTIAEHTGELLSEVKAVRKQQLDALHDGIMRVLFGERQGPGGLRLRVSSGAITRAQFSEQLIDKLQIWAATELGCVLDDPDPEWAFRRQRKATGAANGGAATNHHQGDVNARSRRQPSAHGRSIAGQ